MGMHLHKYTYMEYLPLGNRGKHRSGWSNAEYDTCWAHISYMVP